MFALTHLGSGADSTCLRETVRRLTEKHSKATEKHATTEPVPNFPPLFVHPTPAPMPVSNFTNGLRLH